MKEREMLTVKFAYEGELHVFDKFVTHSGSFHSDEVYATALLSLLAIFQRDGVNRDGKYELGDCIEAAHIWMETTDDLPINVIRVKDATPYEEEENTLVYDIGGGRFDHHQRDHQLHPDGSSYCAFSLLYEALLHGDEYLGHFLYPDLCRFEHLIVESVEKQDTKGHKNAIGATIMYMNSNINRWYAEENDLGPDAFFYRAVLYAMQTLLSWFSGMSSNILQVENIRVSCAQTTLGNIEVVIPYWHEEQFISSLVAAVFPDAKLMINENKRGGYSVRSLDDIDEDGTIHNRAVIAQSRRNVEEQRDYDMLFCHPNGFLATFQTYEQAKEFVRTEGNIIVTPQ